MGAERPESLIVHNNLLNCLKLIMPDSFQRKHFFSQTKPKYSFNDGNCYQNKSFISIR